LRLLLVYVQLQNSLVKNNDFSNGKSLGMETSTSPDDDNDVPVRMESGGVVYDTARPDNPAVSTGKCSHGGNDRCICGMDGT
jgi:hypothetical protein